MIFGDYDHDPKIKTCEQLLGEFFGCISTTKNLVRDLFFSFRPIPTEESEVRKS
jgi:hypothetical protein